MTQTDLAKHYGESFYDHITGRSAGSAKVILGCLYGIYKPKSVIDIGCGQGAWLAIAESFGAGTLVGLDGDWVNKEKLLSKNIEFIPTNFEYPLTVEKKYDLCISLEVAEHISQERAESFVSTLCQASDVVLFSAAIKHQGGTNHINEQWQSYWSNLFKTRGYRCYDIFRPNIWGDSDVEWWYRQNVFLFVKQESKLIEHDLDPFQKAIPDIVHPENYEMKVKLITELNRRIDEPTLRFCLGCIKRYVLRKLRSS